MKTKKVDICKHCNKGLVHNSTSLKVCPHCTSAQQLIEAIKLAISNCKKKNDTKLMENLKAIIKLLPEYSVMAVLEAEARNMSTEFIQLLRDSFDIKTWK